MLAEMNNPMFRPPGEADSLILQVDTGCPHPGCTFCGMYRGLRYRRRTPAAVAAMIDALPARARAATRLFLADGDVMCRPFAELEALLQLLHARFPQLVRVSLYANGRSIASKTDTQLQMLRTLKLHTLYLGLESGDDAILHACRKGETAAGMTDAGVRAQAAGLRLSVMVLLGLGGQARSAEHARATAAVLNRMKPRLLSALRVVPVEGTELYEQQRTGCFTPLSEDGVVRELRALIADLSLAKCVFRANHGSNVIPLEGRLPQDRARLLAELDALLATGVLDRHGPGRLPRHL